MNIYLDEAKKAMDRAASKAEQARVAYNSAVKEWKAAKERHDRLSYIAMETELLLARERAAAQAANDHVIPALLVSR